jgi:LL-diaminopimelate aminotransferase
VFRTNRRFEALPPYPLAGMKEIRLRLEAEGVEILDLGAGDADLAPPPAAVEALARAAADPSNSRYPFQMGSMAYRESIAAWMDRRFGVQVDPVGELLPLIGSKDGIAHLPLAFLDPGDVAVVPDPGYQAYRGGVVLAGGTPHPVRLEADHEFLLRLDAIPGDVVERTKILYLNYPNNPTTAVAPVEYLEAAVDFCRRHRILLAYDNAYSEIAFDGYRPPSILELDGAREVAVELHSLSKTYNMTGWRIGWAVGGSQVISVLSRVKTFLDTGVFLGVQAAAAAALDAWDRWVPGNVAVFQERRDRAVSAFRAAGFRFSPPRATMYLWIRVPGDESAASFARRALEEQGVIVLPGSALGEGGEGFFRIALTVSGDRLEEAARRLANLTREA